MTKQFSVFLVVGLAVIGVVIAGVWFGTKSSHLELEGKVLKVRTLSLSKDASLVVVDFRVTNPSAVPFIVRDVALKLTPATGPEIDGSPASKTDIDGLFEAQKLIGPRFNDVLSLQDRIAPNKTLDRMIGARFEVPESQVDARKSLVLQLEDVDGTVAHVAEKQ
jgi:hypothetical protein